MVFFESGVFLLKQRHRLQPPIDWEDDGLSVCLYVSPFVIAPSIYLQLTGVMTVWLWVLVSLLSAALHVQLMGTMTQSKGTMTACLSVLVSDFFD